LQDGAVTDNAIAGTAPTPPAGPWKFWGTVLWGLAMLTVGVTICLIGIVALLFQLDPGPDLSQEQLARLLLSHDTALVAIFALSYGCAAAILLLAVRLSRLSIRDYLALRLPRPSDVAIGFAGIVMIYVAVAYIGYLSGPSRATSLMVDLYHGASASGGLFVLAIGLVVLAPVSEEIFVRGFLLRGWSSSRLGPVGAVVLSSLTWTAMHAGYDAVALVEIFLAGLWLGWIRLRSGSTVATMILHAAQNAAVLALAMVFYPPV
jgi:uncharacterized protein